MSLLSYEIRCHYRDLERGVEEDALLAFAAPNDVAHEVEQQAALIGARYNTMPRRRSARRWVIREPGELAIDIYAERREEE